MRSWRGVYIALGVTFVGLVGHVAVQSERASREASQTVTRDDDGVPACYRYAALIRGNATPAEKAMMIDGFKGSADSDLRAIGQDIESGNFTPLDAAIASKACARLGIST